jgi:lysophospholipase L1-like esterase
LNYAKRLIYRIIFDGNQDDVIVAYRTALSASFTPEMMENMSVVGFSPIARNYSESLDLYKNPNHLSKKGYQKLGHIISETIVELHKSKVRGME